MAKIVYDFGDYFTSSQGAGVVIGEGEALIVHDEGKLGLTIIRTAIPRDALPVLGLSSFTASQQYALRAAMVVLTGHDPK